MLGCILTIRNTIRSGEGRVFVGATLTLLTMMSAHALLETARDALFLARLPAAELPWVYLAIAGLSLAITELQQRFRGARSWRRVVVRWLVLASVVTFVFWLALAEAGDWALYALYVWSGVVATLVLVRFWQLLGDLFTTSQAKRLYALIGSGSVVGAILGSGLAGLLAATIAPRHLLLAASVALAASALVPLVLLPEPETDPNRKPSPDGARDRGLWESLRVLVSRPYTARLAALVVVSTVALTLADYLFKATVAAQVAPADLGTFFATVYFGLNVLSLLVQLFVVGWLVRSLSITASLVVLPALLMVGAAGFILAGGLAAALVLKGADGALRYSLHRTASELLYVPLTERLRDMVKALIDVVGQRGGQALASLAILALVAAGAGAPWLAAVLAGLLLAWIVLARSLKDPYLDLFRGTLETTLIRTRIAFPELDMSSLEAMIATLNSESDAEVLAATDMLTVEGKTRLIPALILYHPSDEVVVRVLDAFAQAGRVDFLPTARRIYEHRQPLVQAAIVRSVAAVTDDTAFLEARLTDECHIVKATAAVCLLARGDVTLESAQPVLDELFERDYQPALEAAGLAVQHLRERAVPAAVRALLMRLAGVRDSGTQLAAIEAMIGHPHAEYLPLLLRHLVVPELRPAARQALLAQGEVALEYAVDALADASLDYRIRRHLPRTLSRFGSHRAAHALLAHLPEEPDGMVRFKVLRALGQMRLADPKLELEPAALEKAIRDTLRQIGSLLEWRLTLSAAAEADPTRATRVHSLLVQMLGDKGENAQDRLFRLLALRYPARELREITRGLASADAKVRSSGMELLESLLPNPLRGAVLGLVDDLPDASRLQAIAAYHTPSDENYEAVLRRLLGSSSESLRSLAVYHIGELGLSVMTSDLETITVEDSSYLLGIVERVRQALARKSSMDLAYES